MKAKWNGVVIAESNETISLEGNQYFPANSISKEYFISSDLHTICPWKGTALYYTLFIDGAENIDAAWFYPEPKDAASKIKNYVAFWKGVEIEE